VRKRTPQAAGETTPIGFWQNAGFHLSCVMMAEKIRVTKDDVDAVASFVEAANELDLEPFFGKDEQFSQSGSAEHKTIFHLGDRFHFRSALISFRRIWMPREPSHWKTVTGVLTRQNMPAKISLQASLQAQLIEDFILKPEPYLNNEMAGSRVVDLWLNTVFAHGGISGPNKRSDFEVTANKYGQGRFEYAFRTRVRWAGEMFRALSKDAAKPALEFFGDELSLRPSFQIGAAFGTKRKEVTKHGELIIRQASSEHFSEETFEQRFQRILKRTHFDNLAFVLRQFDRTPVEILKAVFAAVSFADLLQKLGGDLEIAPENLDDDNRIADGFCASCTIYDNYYQLYGRAMISRQGKVRTAQKAVMILDRQFATFREELLTD
jgi:hypothetical protein